MTRPYPIAAAAALLLIACGPPATSVTAQPTDPVAMAAPSLAPVADQVPVAGL